MSTTTLKDHGRSREDIPFYYAFPFKFWFRESMIKPEDVQTWCQKNCAGWYKIVSYTHEDSVRKKYSRTNEFEEKIIFIDKIYLSDESDALAIQLAFDVSDKQIVRMEKLKRKVRRKSSK